MKIHGIMLAKELIIKLIINFECYYRFNFAMFNFFQKIIK